MGNIGSQSGLSKFKNSNQDNIQWPHSFPRAQSRFQQNQMKVLPERTPDIRLRPTENGEILQTGGTLTGRQIQSKFGDRELMKCGSEPHLNKLMNAHGNAEPAETEKERKFRKKYKAPSPPQNTSAQSNENSSDDWGSNKERIIKPRIFKTKIQTERKRSVPEYLGKGNAFESRHETASIPPVPPSHRLSLPSLNNPAWDFQGELKEATRRLRKIKCNENDDFYSSPDNSLDESTKLNKLRTLDHQIDKRDLAKLKADVYENKGIKREGVVTILRSEASGKESSIEDFSVPKGKKNIAPKPFYFGMTNTLKSTSLPKNTDSNFIDKNYSDSVSSFEMKHNGYGSDTELSPRRMVAKISTEKSRFPSIAEWKQSSSAESVINPDVSKGSKYSSEEEHPRIFSIFPTRSGSNDRSRSGDSGISGDGSPAVYEDTPEPLTSQKNKLQKILPSWTPQQDLGDDSSFEEESFSAGEFPDPFETEPAERHVFSLSLPRDHHLASYANSDKSPSEANFDFRTTSRVSNGITRKEAESTPENERGNWFLNKSCNALNSNTLLRKYSQISDELDEFLSRSAKFNSGRLMYLPKVDKPIRPRRYETRNRQKINEKRSFPNVENIQEIKSASVPESLQDSPVLSDRKNLKKKPKRFTFQSTIRQIERRRIAEKLSREAEKKEQQRLRELEIMQKVESEFQKKRDREKLNIKQQLSQYSNENARSYSFPELSFETENTPQSREALQARSEPDGAVSSSPTSSLSQLDNSKQENKIFYSRNHLDYVNNNSESKSDSSEETRSKVVKQTQILSEFRQPQREYRDYHPIKKHLLDGVESPRQTTIHPKVTYKMPKSKGKNRHGSNNYRKDFANGVRNKPENSWNNQSSQTKNSPNKYYSQFGPLTRF